MLIFILIGRKFLCNTWTSQSETRTLRHLIFSHRSKSEVRWYFSWWKTIMWGSTSGLLSHHHYYRGYAFHCCWQRPQDGCCSSNYPSTWEEHCINLLCFFPHKRKSPPKDPQPNDTFKGPVLGHRANLNQEGLDNSNSLASKWIWKTRYKQERLEILSCTNKAILPLCCRWKL